jgi:hypothetical protein
MLISPALKRLRQKDHEFETRLGYLPSPKTKTKKTQSLSPTPALLAEGIFSSF